MANTIYDQFSELIGDGTIDLDNDTFKVALLDNGHTIDQTDTNYTDVSADELANGSGYTTGGATLANVAWGQTGGTATFDADDTAWTSATFTAAYAAVYDTTASNALCMVFDFGGDQSVANGTFTIQWNASGIFTLS